MKRKDLVIGMDVDVVSLDHTSVGLSPLTIGCKCSVVEIDQDVAMVYVDGNTSRMWCVSIDDIEPVIKHTHPLHEHLGKEIEVIDDFMLNIDGSGIGLRGFVVGNSPRHLLVDFGDGFDGHDGYSKVEVKYHKETCNFISAKHVKFLQEDDE